jgi:subfamily B ATP-binding cassette protein HlyB/CyaB
MTYTSTTIRDFLAGIAPFNQLSSDALSRVAKKCQMLRYRMGQAVLVREEMPSQVIIVYEGQIRLLAEQRENQRTVTLELLGSGEVLGWAGLVRGVACETAIASQESICIALSSKDFLVELEQESSLATTFRERCSPIEVFELLGTWLSQRADREALLKALEVSNLKELTKKLYPEATVSNVSPGKFPLTHLDSNLVWFVSGGTIVNYPVGSCIIPGLAQADLDVKSPGYGRLIGFRSLALNSQQLYIKPTEEAIALAEEPSTPAEETFSINESNQAKVSVDEIPYAPAKPPAAEDIYPQNQRQNQTQYPYFKGQGSIDATLACFRMLSKHFGMPFRRDVLRRVLVNQMERTGNLSLQLCGAIAELMNLNSQLVKVPASAIGRLPTTAIIAWQGSFAVIYESSDREIVLAVPETGIQRHKTASFIELLEQQTEVLLIKPTKETPKQKFGISWFLPALRRHRKVLIEVLIASFFVQIFGLANPLMTQVIIDKVLVQNSIDTLNVLGTFLVILAIFEAVITSLRTNLFVDTTNRIDLTLGSEIIDHLFRLPLRYFERRPVGELSSRINELENIRQFLTGTALTVVLDAVFSVIYIVVMVAYSWLLTIVALATLPLFIILTMVVSPVVRRQLRTKAERNAETQSYLVEVLGGIQTVKAQNIELRSRWQWQDRYARYVSAGFNTSLTSTTAGSISNFLNKLSSLLLLWVGAFLVLKGQLTLGQLIAFRIIAGYTTSPLLRLVQLWQNFQEVALSLERLSDIIDAPQEVDEHNSDNIPMPVIQGAVKYENVSFSYSNSGPPQLNNINISFPRGKFIGIVGQSGSGKSTLLKLLSRLYEPTSGRILIDDYDISKVELYSLRRQVGMVLQDTLLFNGTVQENIALTNPDATSEEIINAAKIAVAHDFIMSLPNGYNSRVGERGSSLSGGQRQRIAIARTVLQKPRLLILDEATSALDYDSERQVCLNLAEAFRGETVFFITHRLSTIKNADLIMMMDQAAIVEQGVHDELMALKGRYYCLYQQQESQE